MMRRLLPALAFFAIATGLSAAPLNLQEFSGQLPADANVWTVPALGTTNCHATVDDLAIQWIEPDAGVTSMTGVLIVLHGIDAGSFCNRIFYSSAGPWANTKDVIVCNVYYRNLPFYPPYDFGIYQVTDVLRGVGHLLDLYPDVNRRRLYLMGNSGGGQVALQMLSFAPDLWAEVHIHSAITKITTSQDVLSGGYESDPRPHGWDVNFCPSWRTSHLSADQHRQLLAERQLRSPQVNIAVLHQPSALSPRIIVYHGTADPVTDYQHLLDLADVIQGDVGAPLQMVDRFGATGLVGGSWTFWVIEQGDHTYGGAVPGLTNRAAATNTLHPDAYQSARPYEPSLTVNKALPISDQWTYRIQGDLKNCVVSQEIITTGVVEWSLY